jgi:hypothetical protein
VRSLCDAPARRPLIDSCGVESTRTGFNERQSAGHGCHFRDASSRWRRGVVDAKKAGYTPQEYDKHFIAARRGGVGVQVLMSIGSALRKVRKEGTRMTSRARRASAIESGQARDRAREAGANASWRRKALPARVVKRFGVPPMTKAQQVTSPHRSSARRRLMGQVNGQLHDFTASVRQLTAMKDQAVCSG